VEDLGSAPIILLESHDVRVGKILLEVEDVPDVSAPPAIDRLIVVANDAQVAVSASKMFHELILRPIRILIFVDENVLETTAIFLQLASIRREHLYGKEQQIIEVDRVR